MLCLTGISELLTMPRGPRDASDPLGLVTDAALVIDAGRIRWLGPRGDLPRELAGIATQDLGGRVVLPGLVDPHTHLVFAGDRASDFEARCRGETYESIARRGGGIRTTVRATRAASFEALFEGARPRLAALLEAGVTTVEIKSGYGLDVPTELRQLGVIRALGRAGPQRVRATLLFHLMPEAYATDRPAGIAALSELMALAVSEGLADDVDVFCEEGAFAPNEADELLSAARAHGLAIKAHVDQRSATGFASRAAALGARSLEHLEQLDDAGIDAMAEAGTVAVLLPSASLFLGDAARPPVSRLRARGVPMALATDLNPGSSPTFDPWLVATLGCTWYGLTPFEALRGLTAEAACALALEDGTGSLVAGGPADLCVARGARWQDLLYGLGHRPIAETWIGGQRVVRA
jgi:imidazolonepropionase